MNTKIYENAQYINSFDKMYLQAMLDSTDSRTIPVLPKSGTYHLCSYEVPECNSVAGQWVQRTPVDAILPSHRLHQFHEEFDEAEVSKTSFRMLWEGKRKSFLKLDKFGPTVSWKDQKEYEVR